MPSKKKSTTTIPVSLAVIDELCATVDAAGNACNAKTMDASRWCPHHNEERVKLYMNYKAHHAALDSFPEDSICQSSGAIKDCKSLETMKGWNKALMAKYQLLNRCIGARAFFAERFFGNDMDFGHRTFWHYLWKQLQKTEALLAEVETRACTLLLEEQNALWVLERQKEQNDLEEDCSGHDDGIFAAPQKPKPCPTDITDVEDPLNVALREKCDLLWEKIKTRLARYCAPASCKFYAERINVIHACVRRAVYTDAKLLFVAQNYESVLAFLTDSTLDVAIVEALWKAIRFLSQHEVRAAIDDVIHSKKRSGDQEYITILGGRLYKTLSGESFPFHAWGHMTAVFMCYSCVRRVCKTVDEVVSLTHFAVMDYTALSQSALKYDFPYPDSRVLTLCGFIPNTIDKFPPRSVVSKCNCIYDGAPHWEETTTSYVLCAGLSLTDPYAQKFVNACLRDPSLMVVARKGANGRVIKSAPGSKVWAERFRQARTRAGLKYAEWSVERTQYYQDSVLEEACPRIYGTDVIEDCFQVVIVDGGEGSMDDFFAKVARIWLEDVYKLRDEMDLMVKIATPLVKSGEFDIGADGKRAFNRETDVAEAYRRLWGRAPTRLADDETMGPPPPPPGPGKRK